MGNSGGHSSCAGSMCMNGRKGSAGMGNNTDSAVAVTVTPAAARTPTPLCSGAGLLVLADRNLSSHTQLARRVKTGVQRLLPSISSISGPSTTPSSSSSSSSASGPSQRPCTVYVAVFDGNEVDAENGQEEEQMQNNAAQQALRCARAVYSQEYCAHGAAENVEVHLLCGNFRRRIAGASTRRDNHSTIGSGTGGRRGEQVGNGITTHTDTQEKKEDLFPTPRVSISCVAVEEDLLAPPGGGARPSKGVDEHEAASSTTSGDAAYSSLMRRLAAEFQVQLSTLRVTVIFSRGEGKRLG